MVALLYLHQVELSKQESLRLTFCWSHPRNLVGRRKLSPAVSLHRVAVAIQMGFNASRSPGNLSIHDLTQRFKFKVLAGR